MLALGPMAWGAGLLAPPWPTFRTRDWSSVFGYLCLLFLLFSLALIFDCARACQRLIIRRPTPRPLSVWRSKWRKRKDIYRWVEDWLEAPSHESPLLDTQGYCYLKAFVSPPGTANPAAKWARHALYNCGAFPRPGLLNNVLYHAGPEATKWVQSHGYTVSRHPVHGRVAHMVGMNENTRTETRTLRARHIGAFEDLVNTPVATTVLAPELKAYISMARTRYSARYGYHKSLAPLLERSGILTNPHGLAHPHGANKTLEDRSMERILALLKNVPFTAVSSKRTAFGKKAVAVHNVSLTGKDWCRYSDATTRPVNVQTEIAVLHDVLHYLNPSDVAELFRANPNMKTLFATAVIPPELLSGEPPQWPLLYGFRVRGNNLIYVPEGHAGGAYSQPLSCKEWLTVNRITTVDGPLTVSLVESDFAHHTFVIHRADYLPETERCFDAGDYTRLPSWLCASSSPYDSRVRTALINKMMLFADRYPGVAIQDFHAKVSQVQMALTEDVPYAELNAAAHAAHRMRLAQLGLAPNFLAYLAGILFLVWNILVSPALLWHPLAVRWTTQADGFFTYPCNSVSADATPPTLWTTRRRLVSPFNLGISARTTWLQIYATMNVAMTAWVIPKIVVSELANWLFTFEHFHDLIHDVRRWIFYADVSPKRILIVIVVSWLAARGVFAIPISPFRVISEVFRVVYLKLLIAWGLVEYYEWGLAHTVASIFGVSGCHHFGVPGYSWLWQFWLSWFATYTVIPRYFPWHVHPLNLFTRLPFCLTSFGYWIPGSSHNHPRYSTGHDVASVLVWLFLLWHLGLVMCGCTDSVVVRWGLSVFTRREEPMLIPIATDVPRNYGSMTVPGLHDPGGRPDPLAPELPAAPPVPDPPPEGVPDIQLAYTARHTGYIGRWAPTGRGHLPGTRAHPYAAWYRPLPCQDAAEFGQMLDQLPRLDRPIQERYSCFWNCVATLLGHGTPARLMCLFLATLPSDDIDPIFNHGLVRIETMAQAAALFGIGLNIRRLDEMGQDAAQQPLPVVAAQPGFPTLDIVMNQVGAPGPNRAFHVVPVARGNLPEPPDAPVPGPIVLQGGFNAVEEAFIVPAPPAAPPDAAPVLVPAALPQPRYVPIPRGPAPGMPPQRAGHLRAVVIDDAMAERPPPPPPDAHDPLARVLRNDRWIRHQVAEVPAPPHRDFQMLQRDANPQIPFWNPLEPGRREVVQPRGNLARDLPRVLRNDRWIRHQVAEVPPPPHRDFQMLQRDANPQIPFWNPLEPGRHEVAQPRGNLARDLRVAQEADEWVQPRDGQGGIAPQGAQIQELGADDEIVGLNTACLEFDDYRTLISAPPREYCSVGPVYTGVVVPNAVQARAANTLNREFPVLTGGPVPMMPRRTLEPSYYDFTADRAKADVLAQDLRDFPNLWLVRDSDRSAPAQQRAMVKFGDERTVKLVTLFGVPGCGKTTAAKKVIAQQDIPVSEQVWAFPSQLLAGDALQKPPAQQPLGEEAYSSQYVSGLEVLRKGVGRLVVLDDFTRWPPATLDWLIFNNPALEVIVVTGDPAQTQTAFPEQGALSRTLESIGTDLMKRPPLVARPPNYATVSWRLPMQIAQLLGFHSAPGVRMDGNIIVVSKPPPGIPLLVTSPRFAETKTHGGTPAYVIATSQGLEFDGDYCLDLGGMTDAITDASALVALTRGKRNVFLYWPPENRAVKGYGWSTTPILGSMVYLSAQQQSGVLQAHMDRLHTVVRRAVYSHIVRAARVDVPGFQPNVYVGVNDGIPSQLGQPPTTDNANLAVQFQFPHVGRLNRAQANRNNALRGFHGVLNPDVPRPADGDVPPPNVPADPMHLPGLPDYGDAESRESRVPGIGATHQFPEHKHPGAQHHRRNDRATERISLNKRLKISTPQANRRSIFSGHSRFSQLRNGFLKQFPNFRAPRDLPGLLEQCAEECLDSWVEKRTIKAIHAALVNETPDWDLQQTRVFLKSQVVRKRDTFGGPAKAGQIVATFPVAKTFRDAVYALLLEKVVLQDCPDHVMLYLRKTPADLTEWVENHMSGAVSFTENDYTAWDSSIDGPFVEFDCWLLRAVGVPDDYIAQWKEERVATRCFMGNLRLMQHSGDRYTFLLNTLRNLALTNAQYSCMDRRPQAFGGDDSLLRGTPVFAKGFRPKAWLMEPKTHVTRTGHLFGFEVQDGHLYYDWRYMLNRLSVGLDERAADRDFFVSFAEQLMTHPEPDSELYATVYQQLVRHVHEMGWSIPHLPDPPDYAIPVIPSRWRQSNDPGRPGAFAVRATRFRQSQARRAFDLPL